MATAAPEGLAVLSPALLGGASVAYLALLFAFAWWADRRAAQGRSVIGHAGVYALSLGVYCSAWTYYGSVGRAAATGVWFLPIYLGPTLAMVLAWFVVRKMIRIARTWRITSIADFIASRYGKSRRLAGGVTLIALAGVVPYIALQLKAVAVGYAVLTTGSPGGASADHTLWVAGVAAVALAAFTIAFGTRHLDTTERHEGMVAAIAAESVVKLAAFVAVGAFVCWGLFDGPADLWARALADPRTARVLTGAAPGAAADAARPFAYAPWFALIVLSGLSVLLLPRQFQVMVVENVDERHVRRAAWAFPAYLLAINVFVLPIALGGLLLGAGGGGAGGADAETFVLSLPLAHGAPALALLAFIGGLSAATGMVIVETIAVATMVGNDLVLPLLLRRRTATAGGDLARPLLAVRRIAIVVLMALGWLYFGVAGEAYALVSIGLISFAAVAQFAPALLGGMYWKGGTRDGALAGLTAGAALWAYTLMLPSLAKSGWIDASFMTHGPFGWAWLKPEALFGLTGLDNLTHALFWSLGINTVLFVGVSLARAPGAAEAALALQFVDVFEHRAGARVFWRGRARVAELRALLARVLGQARARALLADGGAGADDALAEPPLVQRAETALAGAVGGATARAMVAAVAHEERLEMTDVMRIVEEASELRQLNQRLQSLDKLKDDFMSSVTHELRTPLTSIRALTELMRDDPEMDAAQRAEFLTLVVAESERLSRLVNQVLDMAKIESGHAEWRAVDVDLRALLERAIATTAELYRERGAVAVLHAPDAVPRLRADDDRLLQVALNLLSNAAKFVPTDGSGRVEVRLTLRAAGLRVEIEDNGPGVPPAQQALVFEKFRQGGDERNRPQGTGLGLPISRRIVEHFGGRLWLRSPPGRGACFGFDLPLETPPPPPHATPAAPR